jgi:hypothetical protein
MEDDRNQRGLEIPSHPDGGVGDEALPEREPLSNLTRVTLREGRYAYIDLDSIIGIYPEGGSSIVVTSGGHSMDVPGSPDAIFKLLAAAELPDAPDAPERGR